MSKKKESREPINKKVLITNIVLWTLGVAAVLIVLFWDSIFTGEGQQIFKGNNGFAAMGEWFANNLHVLIYTVVVIAISLLIIALLNLGANKLRLKNKKAATFLSLIRSLIKWAIIIVAIFLILTKWGVDTNKILASIGIIALIVGLGCQSLISDVVAGIFLVADSAFEVGDIVVVDDFRGTVVEIGLKNTKIEDAGGNVKVISNSSINTMVNLTNSLSLAVVNISIPYEENLKRTETLLVERLKDMQKRIPSIVEGPYYKGVEDMADSAVILKVIAKVKEEDRFQATRDIKRDIYIFLNENKITVPYPQLTITQGPNPADHPEWVDKEKEEQKALKELAKQQEESKDAEVVNEIK
jgi:small conductance mechanosensitive channel